MKSGASEKLANARAAGFDETENTPAEEFVRRRDELMVDPKARNPKIWENAGAPIAVTLESLGMIERGKQTGQTVLAMQRVIAAARLQAYVETLARPHMQTAHKGAERVEALVKGMTRDQLKEAARGGLRKQEGE